MLTKIRNLKREKPQSGFTIIEVMIVLAIAGLILLIVFLAVPALQRSARNTQRKNDAAAVAGAVANYISNNNGSVPDTMGYAANAITISCVNNGAFGSTCDKTDTNTETAKVGIFTAAAALASASTPTANMTGGSTSSITYVPGWNCNSSNTGLGSPSPRTAALLYQLESGSGTPSNECEEQ